MTGVGTTLRTLLVGATKFCNFLGKPKVGLDAIRLVGDIFLLLLRIARNPRIVKNDPQSRLNDRKEIAATRINSR